MSAGRYAGLSAMCCAGCRFRQYRRRRDGWSGQSCRRGEGGVALADGDVGGETDRTGHYQVEGIPAGEYAFQVRSAGFKTYEIQSIRIGAGQRLRVPDTALRVGDLCGRPLQYESLRILPGAPDSGSLKGSVYPIWPPFSRVSVTLVCDAGRVCGSTQTSWTGKFEFRDLPTGWYELKISRRGFYPEEEKDLPVSAGLEQVYFPLGLDKCPNGNCDPKLRRIKVCE